jgi:membrane-associated phospholipid phosphatase
MASGSASSQIGTGSRREFPDGHGPAATLAAIVANIAAFMVLFQLYKLVRKTFIQRAETVAFGHADQIIDLERRLRIFIEPDLQRWLLHHEALIRPFNRYYAAFMPLFYACCVVAITLAPARFRQLRRVFVLSMLIALPWYALYPLAPPRFMPQEGFVDTLAVYGPQYFNENNLVTANHYAAMPSMHVGWTTIGAFMLAAVIPYRRIGTVLGGLYVAVMCLTVIVTANHYVLDIIGGWLVIAAAFGAARFLPAEVRWPWRQDAMRADRRGHPSDRQSSQYYEKLKPASGEGCQQSAVTVQSGAIVDEFGVG